MHDQILTGVLAAIQSAGEGDGSPYLRHLTDGDVRVLVREVLHSLSVTPEGTPEPVVTVTPAATPTLMLSPADVVAMLARDAFTDAEANDSYDEGSHGGWVTEATWPAGEDRREFREFLFATQSMFGCRVRSIAREGDALFLVAGTYEQVRAFHRVATLIHDLAQPTVAGLGTDERKAFWATLGTLVAATDRALALVRQNAEYVAAATDYLNREHGRSRNLARTAPVTSGAVYDQAVAVMAQSEQA